MSANTAPAPLRLARPGDGKAWLVVVMIVLALCREAAWSADAVEVAAVERESVRQKLELLGNMVWGSPLARRVEKTADPEVMARLAEGRRLHELARVLLEAGNAAEAARHIDDAIRDVAVAARSSAQADPGEAQVLARYHQLRESIAVFMSTLEEMKSGGTAAPDTLAAYNLIEVQARGVLAHAAAIAESDPRRALAEIAPVSRLVEETIANARDAQTLVYSLEFDSPAHEHQHELVRNDSYERLVSRLASEGDLSEGTRTVFFAVLARNEEHRAAAREAAASGDFEAAMARLRRGTERLMASLRLAGLGL